MVNHCTFIRFMQITMVNEVCFEFYAFAAAVRKEIADETDRITGKSKQISNVPIHLSIYSPHGPYAYIMFQSIFIVLFM